MRDFSLKIDLVVCRFDLGTPVNLNKLVTWLGAKKIARGKVLLVVEKKRKIIICRSGKGWISGYKTESACRRVLNHIIEYMRLNAEKVKLEPINIQAHGTLPFGVNLQKLSELLPNSQFLPFVTRFPNFQYWLGSVKGGFAVISSRGKISVMGLKSIDDVKKAERELDELFKKYAHVLIMPKEQGNDFSE